MQVTHSFTLARCWNFSLASSFFLFSFLIGVHHIFYTRRAVSPLVHHTASFLFSFLLLLCIYLISYNDAMPRCALVTSPAESGTLSLSLSLWSVQHCCNSAQSEVDNSAGCPNSLSFSSLLLWTFVVCSFSDCSRDHQVFFFLIPSIPFGLSFFFKYIRPHFCPARRQRDTPHSTRATYRTKMNATE